VCRLFPGLSYFATFSFLGVDGALGGESVVFMMVLRGDSGDSGKAPPRVLSYSYQTPLILLFSLRGGGLILFDVELHVGQGCVDCVECVDCRSDAMESK